MTARYRPSECLRRQGRRSRPDREQRVDRSNADVELRPNRFSFQWIDRLTEERDVLTLADRLAAVERTAAAVQHPTEQRIPDPTNDTVEIQRRAGGRFAVIRFAGRMDGESTANAEERLRKWMNDKGLIRDGDAELAGYDPPWTPGPLRRNEVLILLK